MSNFKNKSNHLLGVCVIKNNMAKFIGIVVVVVGALVLIDVVLLIGSVAAVVGRIVMTSG